MLALTIGIAAWLMADLLLPMMGLTGGDSPDSPLMGIATRNLGTGHRVVLSDVEPLAAPAAGTPAAEKAAKDPKSRTPAAVGRVLSKPVATGGKIRASDLVPRTPGENIARQLPSGYRAITVTLRDNATTVALYPGASVDVLSTIDVPVVGGARRESMTHTVIDRARVLAVDDDAVGAMPASPGEERRSTSRKHTVTLAVTPEQAAQVEFASTKGSIGLALRGEDDASISGEAFAMARHPDGGTDDRPTTQDQRKPSAAQQQAPGSTPGPVAKGEPAAWEVTVNRGKDTEKVTFPATPVKPKTP